MMNAKNESSVRSGLSAENDSIEKNESSANQKSKATRFDEFKGILFEETIKETNSPKDKVFFISLLRHIEELEYKAKTHDALMKILKETGKLEYHLIPYDFDYGTYREDETIRDLEGVFHLAELIESKVVH